MGVWGFVVCAFVVVVVGCWGGSWDSRVLRMELSMSWCSGWDVSGVMRWPLNHAGVVGVLKTRS